MAEPLLFVPGYGISPRACEDVPAIHTALESLREHFDVTIFHWPTVKGGPRKPLTWQGSAEAIGEALPLGCHVVAIRNNVTYALLAIGQRPNLARTLVCDGFDVPVATWVALGHRGDVGALEAAMRLDATSQFGRLFMKGADEALAQHILDRYLADANRSDIEEFERHTETLNLLEVQTEVSLPALYVHSEMPYLALTERRELFKRFVPDTEFVEMDPWRLHEPESGREFANLAIPFMKKHSARTILSAVLFADIVDSTVHAATMGDRRWSQVLSQFHDLVGRELKRGGGKLVDTAGDGFVAVFDDPGAAITCAMSVAEAAGDLGLKTRAGVHAGQVEVSGEKYSGVAVHTAARVAARAAPGEVLVSETVRQLLAGSGLAFEERGSHELKGLPEPVTLHAVARQ
jgi:class 3 adenylate cyclase